MDFAIPIFKKSLEYGILLIVGIILLFLSYNYKNNEKIEFISEKLVRFSSIFTGYDSDAGTYIIVQFDLPDEIKIGQSFIITAMYKPPSSDFQDYWLADAVVSLELAGAEISPKKPQKVGADFETTWSVAISEIGTHSGFTLMDLSGRRYNQANSKLTIKVGEEKNVLEGILKISGIILGLIISITNIIVFAWKWKDRRKIT